MDNYFYKEKKDIQEWLQIHKITNYELLPDKDYGFIVNVNESVYLARQGLEFIPVKFGKINGHFSCGSNQLKTLEFAPHYVRLSFSCSDNQLTSLEHCPKHIGVKLHASGNKIETLEFFPEYVKWTCHFNNNKGLGKWQKETNFQLFYQEYQKINLKKRLDEELKEKNIFSKKKI